MAFSQNLTKHRVDTVLLYPFEYTKNNTNNGSACSYYIRNSSNANIATAVNLGGPDSIKFDNGSLFNGIHILVPGQQIIAVGDFMGRQLSTENLSSESVAIIIALYCPN